MAKNKFYAVAVGKVPGIYNSWSECESQVKGYPGAKFKGFADEKQAQAFVMADDTQADEQADISETPVAKEYSGRHVNIFVDGSYNSDTDNYGYGVFVDDPSDPVIFSGKDTCGGTGRNIKGEVRAASEALKYASESGKYDSVTIYHDYKGIHDWCDAAENGKPWTANEVYSKEYADFVSSVRRNGLAVDFVHVPGHTGVTGNEYVDKIAKIACGIAVSNKDNKFLDSIRNVKGFPSERELPDVPAAEEESCMDYND